MSLRRDLYDHEAQCPYSIMNQGGFMNLLGDLDNIQTNSLRQESELSQNLSACFESFKKKTSNDIKTLGQIINNLTALVKSQDEKIKELKLRVETLEDGKLKNMIDLSKLNHNVNTQVNIELLTTAQVPASKGWFGAHHYDTMQSSLDSLKEFYEHPDWRLLTNLGLTQIYSKKEEDEKILSVLCRTEINHRIFDIAEEIYNQEIFMKGNPYITKSEIIQKVGDGINVHYMQYNKFLISSEADAIFVSQKIEYVDESGLETIVFPIVSTKNSRKKEIDEFERLEFLIGGWVLKALGNNKTLVNAFYKIQYSKSTVPETIVSKNAKTMISMLRTLELSCNKNFVNYRFGSKIFEKTISILNHEDEGAAPVYEEAKKFQVNMPKEESKETPSLEELKLEPNPSKEIEFIETKNGLQVPTPTDIPDLDPNSVNQEYKEYILGTRAKLGEFIKMVNEGNWKRVTNKKDKRIFTKTAESGLICVKGETYFPFDAEKIIEYIKRADIRHEYDKYTDSAFIIKETDHRTILAYAKIKKVLVVSSRDLTFATQLITSKQCKTLYCPTYSIELDDHPPREGSIRAALPIGGWVLMETPEGGCKAVYASEIDFKGNIPKFMLEKSADIQVAVLTSLKKYMMDKEGVKEGQVWKRPASEKLPDQEPTSNLKEITPPVKINYSIDQNSTSNDVNKGTIQNSSDQNSVEESKGESKYFSIPLDLKTKTKKGTPEELGFSATFASLTDKDFLEEIPEETKGRDYIILAREEALRLCKEINGEFVKVKPSKEVGIFTRDNGDQGNSVLGVGEIPYNIDTIAEVLCDEKQRKGFDDLLDEAEIIEELPHMTFLMYVKFKKVLILSARDFVCCGAFIKFKDGTYAFPTFSIEREDRPEDKKLIRAHLFCGGWVLRALDENRTMAYYYNRADMKGTIPAW
eukprot:CAMPEP_0197006980 /NCGR_PEP_ID=MMETSP1380-20130617/38317_1 /TAXON_ID=5936 /ORGANISM="Euplotes crassus, Strain CT5" /LENGTH=921 /DNA_ID=CAMNT_0042426863 /DNA_START=160 /DNA_END=2922 /DNA_ORIENTATION=+